jgi:hypothetical protein
MSSSKLRTNTASWVLAVIAFAGCTSDEIVVTEGSAGYQGGQVLAPGARLIVAGQGAEEAIDAAGTDLVAVERDGAVYFYHPSMGVVELTEEASRRAVGRWLANLDASGKVQSVEQALSIVTPGEKPMASDVGMTLEVKTENVNQLIATNQTRRWTAITTDTGTQPYYILPRGNNGVPTNVVSAFLADVGSEAAATNMRNDIPINLFGEAFGAVTRGLPLILLSSEKIEAAQKARVANQDLFTKLNLLDFYYMALEGTRAITGVFAIDCLEVLTNLDLTRQLDNFVTDMLKSNDPELTRKLHTEGMKEVTNAMAKCAGEATVGASTGWIGAVALEALSTMLNIIGVLNWLVDDVAYTALESAFGVTAYEEFGVGEATGECCFYICASGSNNSGAGVPSNIWNCLDYADNACGTDDMPRLTGTANCTDCADPACFSKWQSRVDH